MPTTHTTATRNAMAEAVRTGANVGAQTTLVIFTAANVQLVSINIADFGAASGGVITSSSSGNSGTAGATGVASYGRVNDGSGTEVFRGDVGVGSGEVQISSTSISTGDTVSLTNNPTWTAPS